MNLYPDNDGRFPEDSEVWTPYPLTEDNPPYEEWPWLRGTVIGQYGPDEWHIVLQIPELMEHGDGYDWWPACFRNSSELRPVHNTFAVWHAWLRDTGFLIENNGGLAQGTVVSTPFFDDVSDWADMMREGVPSTYCAPDWPWRRGKILGQADAETWYIFVQLGQTPFLCRRNINDIDIFVTDDGE